MKRLVPVALVFLAVGLACFEEPAPTDDVALKERAKTIVSNIFAGKYASVRQDFDPTMAAELSEEGLAEATSRYQSMFGSFVRMGVPEIVDRAALRVVNVPLEMSEGEGQARITFDTQGRIAGLFLLRTGVPVP